MPLATNRYLHISNKSWAFSPDAPPELQSIAPQIQQNYLDIERWARGLGGGRPYSTVVVAAANSTAADKANADVVCTTASANFGINAAINLLNPTTRGRVLLLEGLYEINAPIIMPGSMVLEGMGDSTVLRATTYGIYILRGATNNNKIANIRFEFTIGGVVAIWFDTFFNDANEVLNCTFIGVNVPGILESVGIIYAENASVQKVIGCKFYTCYRGILCFRPWGGIYSHNQFLSCQLGIYLPDNSQSVYTARMLITSNTFANCAEGGVWTGTYSVNITANYFRDSTSYDIFVYQFNSGAPTTPENAVQIHDNQFHFSQLYCIELTESSYACITGNYFHSCDDFAIYVRDLARHNFISGNYFLRNRYGIYVNGNGTTYNNISNNMFREHIVEAIHNIGDYTRIYGNDYTTDIIFDSDSANSLYGSGNIGGAAGGTFVTGSADDIQNLDIRTASITERMDVFDSRDLELLSAIG